MGVFPTKKVIQTIAFTLPKDISQPAYFAAVIFDDWRREFHLRATYGMDQQLIDAERVCCSPDRCQIDAPAANVEKGQRTKSLRDSKLRRSAWPVIG